MNYEQKNTNRPMVVVDKQNHIRHGGWYGHYTNDMDVASQSFSWDFHATRSPYCYAADHGLDSLYRQTHGHRHAALCRSRRDACSRCLSSLFSRCTLAYGSTLEDIGAHSGCDVLSNQPDHSGFGRHPVSSLRAKNQWCRMVTRCGVFDQEQTCFRVGIEPGRTDLADSTALGRRTVGSADQHAIASQERATAPLKHYQRTATGARTSFHVGLHLLAPHPSFYRLG